MEKNTSFTAATPRVRPLNLALGRGIPPDGPQGLHPGTPRPANPAQRTIGSRPVPFTMGTQAEEEPGLQVKPPGDASAEHTSTETSRPPSLVLDGPQGGTPDANASPSDTSPAHPGTIDPPPPPNAFVKALLEQGQLVVRPDPKGGWRYALAPRRWGKDDIQDKEYVKLLVKTAQAWVQDPSQALQAIDFLEQVIDHIGDFDTLADTLNQFAPSLLLHCPPPCDPQRIPRILGAAEYCVAHLPAEGISQGLADLGAAYCPWVALEKDLSKLAQFIGNEAKEAPPLAQRLQALQQQALALQRWELAAKALTLVQRLVQISNADAQQEALKKLLNQMEKRWADVQKQRFPMPEQRSLFCTDPPLAYRAGSGAGAHFVFRTDTAMLAPLIVKICRGQWATGQQAEALALLNDALNATSDEDARERLLRALAGEPGFFEHMLWQPRPRRQGIVDAAFALLPGWWLKAPPHAFEPDVRERLIDLVAEDDWQRCLTLFEREFNYGLNEAAQKRLVRDLAEPLLQRLQRVQQRAHQLGDIEWQQRCLRWAQQLLARLGDSTGPKATRLKKGCQRFIESCHRIPPEHYLAAMGDWLNVEQLTGQDGQAHTMIQVQGRSPALQTAEGRARERVRFADYVDLLLESPDGPDWTHVLRLTRKAALALGQPFDQQQQLGWCLREAGRGNTQPLEAQVNGLIKEHGPQEATGMLFDALCQASDRDVPWATLEKAINTVRMMGWKPSDHQQFLLRSMQARRGHAQPLLDWLRSDRTPHELNRPLVNELLALARLPELTRSVRIRLLSAAKAQFTKFDMQAEDLDTALNRLREERQEFQQRKAAAQPSPRKPPIPAAQQALAQWVDVDLSQPTVIKVSAPPDKAPQTAEQRRRAQAALLTWLASMQAEAQPRPWSQWLGAVEGIEIAWGWNIDRQRLLALCLDQVAQENSIQPLLDHLPLIHEVQPSLALQAQLLSLATRQDWDAAQRAALIKRLIAWAPTSGVLNPLFMRAIRSLPEGPSSELAALLLEQHGRTLSPDQVRELQLEHS